MRCALLLLLAVSVAAQPIGNACNASSPSQQWTYTASTGALRSASRGQCLASRQTPPSDGTSLTMAACDGSLAQAFDLVPSGSLIVARSRAAACVNLAGYGTAPGTDVWLYGCTPAPEYTCQGNCDWEFSGAAIQNNESKLCLDDGLGPLIPRTCSPGSVSAALPFCDAALPFEARAQDLVSRLPMPYKLALIMLPFPVAPRALAWPALDIAAFFWDMTAIHGLSFFEPGTFNPSQNFTSFPHAIAQAASWDVQLVRRITAASAYEARAVSQQVYNLSGGLILQSLMAEGGPLANSVHHPSWGRAQETYGECPTLISAMGVAATQELQSRTSQGFLQVASMTRHFLGYHGATDLPRSGEEWVSPQWLVEQHLPAYQALMVEGAAEAVMCSCNTMRVGPGDGSAGGIPACVHPLYYHILRNVWNSSAVVQADNEAIFPMWQDHHYYPNLEQAMAGFLAAGGVAVDSGGGVAIIAALTAALADGSVKAAQIDAAVERTFLTRMRLGEFDYFNSDMPFRGYDESRIDGQQHRALAREAAAKTLVLLRNENATLPLNGASLPKRIAVIGPWGNATDRLGNYGHCNEGMEGNYASTTSFVSTVIEALSEELAALGGGFTLAFVQGSNAVTPLDNGLAEAAAAAAAADLVILAVGLGCQVEAEGLDRSYLTLPPPQQQLLAAVSLALPAASKLVLLSVSAGVIDLDEELADAWVSMGYPGEEAGHGLMDVLFGRVSPSGRLPLTGYADEYLAVCGPTADFNMVSSSTGVGRTYRFAHRIPQGMVKLMFGTGLSYSTFAYSAPAASFNSSAGAVTVTALLENTGAFPGASQVTQVYVAPPQVQGLVTPLRSLAAFTISQPGGPGQGEALAFTLAYPGAFYVTLADGSRQVSGGVYSIFVGGHQPGDARGDRVANVLQVNVSLPASALLPPPFPA